MSQRQRDIVKKRQPLPDSYMLAIVTASIKAQKISVVYTCICGERETTGIGTVDGCRGTK